MTSFTMPGAALKGASARAQVQRRSNALAQRVSVSVGAGRGRAASKMVTQAASNCKFFVGGNWKCNGTTESIDTLVRDLNAGKIDASVDIVCAPPMAYIQRVKDSIDSKYQLAAQNCWTGPGGAFTGETSADMLVDTNIPWVILGHSERRQMCGETNEVVGQKCAYALEKGLSIIPCIGETLEEREGGTMLSILEGQMQAIADNVKDWSNVVIAYEPIWAIGTGVVASPAQAQEVHAALRKWLTDNVGAAVADSTRILYGGSVNAGNCEELAKLEDIDGFLVGGASLQGEAFVTICNAAKHSGNAGSRDAFYSW
eukprot:CAMPEP_0182862860 /NCGR_PEP_ID=MMETSP0034_2-20130328/6312_1 /TAXON_ID=156128 /ORGANISM="Nephroselmis pyriformis, Strain CCMP717" /LENGTH=313 /DNA_ID=CAMNT_0024994999 /DNA_START=38 /DNA_END=979 /DNA_ORIENTATION=-